MFLDLPQRDNLSKPCYSIVFCRTVAIFLNFALAINYLVRYVSFDSVHETKLTHQLYIYILVALRSTIIIPDTVVLLMQA